MLRHRYWKWSAFILVDSDRMEKFGKLRPEIISLNNFDNEITCTNPLFLAKIYTFVSHLQWEKLSHFLHFSLN